MLKLRGHGGLVPAGASSTLPARVLADRTIAKLREAEKALHLAITLHQTKVVVDYAAGMELFAARQGLGDTIKGYAHQIYIEALWKLGGLLEAMPKASGTRGTLRGRDASGGTVLVPPERLSQTLSELGIDRKVSSLAQQLARLPAPTRDAIAQREVSLTKATHDARTSENRAKRHEVIAQAGDAPLAADRRYPLLYADPPWRYEHVKTESRAIENQYPTMDLDAICALPVAPVATADAILFLWATSPKLAEAMAVVTAWGFTYRTSLVWVKDQIGMGYYARQQHELLLVATQGSPPTPAPADRPASVVTAPRGVHSEKPEVFYTLLERMYPTFPKLELFARRPREGWAQWGNQA